MYGDLLIYLLFIYLFSTTSFFHYMLGISQTFQKEVRYSYTSLNSYRSPFTFILFHTFFNLKLTSIILKITFTNAITGPIYILYQFHSKTGMSGCVLPLNHVLVHPFFYLAP